MPKTSERIRGFGESVIRRMTRIANQHNAINLSQGFPDFDPPQALLEAGIESMRNGPHQYAVTWGAADFRQALAAKQSRFMGLEIDPDRHLVVTCGSTEAMMAAMLTVCNPSDKVIVFSPFYENYGADTILSGADPIFVPLVPPGFNFDPAVLEAAFAQKPKALILCNPANPSGKVFTEEELLIIARLSPMKFLRMASSTISARQVHSAWGKGCNSSPASSCIYCQASACEFLARLGLACRIWQNKPVRRF